MIYLQGDKVFIFEDWVNGWFFNVLEALANLDKMNFYSGFIILTSSLPYIEMMGQIKKGKVQIEKLKKPL